MRPSICAPAITRWSIDRSRSLNGSRNKASRPARRGVDPDEAKPVAMPAPKPEGLANLVRRGQDYLKNGDLAAARLVLRRAVSGDDPQAALALGATFDPLVFG